MPGTTEGGKTASITNRNKYGGDFYARIGALGGKNGHTGGFAHKGVGTDGLTGKERAMAAGAKGGRISKRGPNKK